MSMLDGSETVLSKNSSGSQDAQEASLVVFSTLRTYPRGPVFRSAAPRRYRMMFLISFPLGGASKTRFASLSHYPKGI